MDAETQRVLNLLAWRIESLEDKLKALALQIQQVSEDSDEALQCHEDDFIHTERPATPEDLKAIEAYEKLERKKNG